MQRPCGRKAFGDPEGQDVKSQSVWELQVTLETGYNLDGLSVACSPPAAPRKPEPAVVLQEDTGSRHAGVLLRKQDPKEIAAS